MHDEAVDRYTQIMKDQEVDFQDLAPLLFGLAYHASFPIADFFFLVFILAYIAANYTDMTNRWRFILSNRAFCLIIVIFGWMFLGPFFLLMILVCLCIASEDKEGGESDEFAYVKLAGNKDDADADVRPIEDQNVVHMGVPVQLV